jgi:hypothetical protein
VPWGIWLRRAEKAPSLSMGERRRLDENDHDPSHTIIIGTNHHQLDIGGIQSGVGRDQKLSHPGIEPPGIRVVADYLDPVTTAGVF